jgi:hypothetical protein
MKKLVTSHDGWAESLDKIDHSSIQYKKYIYIVGHVLLTLNTEFDIQITSRDRAKLSGSHQSSSTDLLVLLDCGTAFQTLTDRGPTVTLKEPCTVPVLLPHAPESSFCQRSNSSNVWLAKAEPYMRMHMSVLICTPRKDAST